jgi:tRNA G18 (ribose-2'-O)-methylase SpoU
VIPISDPADPRLDGYRGLRGKESREVLWAEGITVVERLLDSGLPITSLLVSTKAVDRLMYLVERTDAPVLVVPPDVITEVLGFVLQRGIVAMAPRPPLAELDDVIRDATRLVVLEGLNDAENLGAIARSARGLGADGMVLDATCADPYYRRSVRVSMGEMLHLPIARVELTEALERLGARDPGIPQTTDAALILADDSVEAVAVRLEVAAEAAAEAATIPVSAARVGN